MTEQQFSCELPPAARSVTEARRFVLAALTTWGRDSLADTAALLTSEVVTNAVLHARTPLHLAVSQVSDGVCVEVTDGSRRKPTLRQADGEATNGRGIEMLDRLADHWDVSLHRNGKTLRFTVSSGRDPWADFASIEGLAEL
jgi:anti-sigma regulatory factor (Ser/Thr protein kinase)